MVAFKRSNEMSENEFDTPSLRNLKEKVWLSNAFFLNDQFYYIPSSTITLI